MYAWIFFFFFFQAEDGIRDLTVTGVQTCALPISTSLVMRAIKWPVGWRSKYVSGKRCILLCRAFVKSRTTSRLMRLIAHAARQEIGRASCRERGEIAVVGGCLKKKKRKIGGV